MLMEILAHSTKQLQSHLGHDVPMIVQETGTLIQVGQGVARCSGIPGVVSQELVQFEDGTHAIAFNLDPEEVGLMLLGHSDNLSAGGEVRRTGQVINVPVGPGLLGRVVNGLGQPLDERGVINGVDRRPIEAEAPPILDRAPVVRPLQTGIKAIDALIPVGRGQRELILGDRQTGKTAIGIATIVNQHDKNVICIYCAIGQRSTATARVLTTLREHQAFDYTIAVVSSGDDSPGLQFITPYAATTMAEYFMRQGRDVLIVYDDLTRHADAYRQLSLLLRRPPGREAYPGDIFYIHSRLLERAAQLNATKGGGSLSALPIIETEAQNLSAYIPTNLVSITDGQIYLSPERFRLGQMPAIDIGKSVSRVGGKTQFKSLSSVAGDLRLTYSQFEELETYTRLGTRLDEPTRQAIERGYRIREVLQQDETTTLSIAEQVAVLLCATAGLFDEQPIAQTKLYERSIRQAVLEQAGDICQALNTGEPLTDLQRARLLTIAKSVQPH
jgi:F-type H+/Na+-transporting ATPase subunit alpha